MWSTQVRQHCLSIAALGHSKLSFACVVFQKLANRKEGCTVDPFPADVVQAALVEEMIDELVGRLEQKALLLGHLEPEPQTCFHVFFRLMVSCSRHGRVAILMYVGRDIEG